MIRVDLDNGEIKVSGSIPKIAVELTILLRKIRELIDDEELSDALIESIINNAVDINPVDTKRDMDILNGSPKLTEEVNAVKTEVSDVNNNEVKIEAEPEKDEPAKSQNKFFNVLESEEVNMNMEEKPKKAPEFATSPNGIFNFTPEFKEEPQPAADRSRALDCHREEYDSRRRY